MRHQPAQWWLGWSEGAGDGALSGYGSGCVAAIGDQATLDLYCFCPLAGHSLCHASSCHLNTSSRLRRLHHHHHHHQLNIRKLLDEAGLPPINIICQKVANQGLTRFEDRRRLPLGISVNFNSMAAKLLTQVCWVLEQSLRGERKACSDADGRRLHGNKRAVIQGALSHLHAHLCIHPYAHTQTHLQVAVSPMSLPVLTHLGGDVEFSIVDASTYCSR